MQQEIWFQKYQILGLIGKGGSAKVFLAEHVKLKSLRAIKFISKNHPLYDLQLKEAFVLKNLKHSGIPIIYDIEENEDGSYIIEQYLEGNTLKDTILQNGPLRENIIINLGLQLCDLLQYLHSIERPILYLDLKPENIILCEGSLKLVDFGSALYMDETQSDAHYYGTNGYAAPELYTNQHIDERCGVYGIGCLLYYMVTGQSIRQLGSKKEHIDYTGACSKKLKKVISRCLRFYPSQRYASVIKLNAGLLELKKHIKYQAELSQTITIAIGGSHPYIGVTHMAFRLGKYLIGTKASCLYHEKNDTGSVWSLKCVSDKVDIINGIYIIEGIPMVPAHLNVEIKKEDYRYVIQDYGCVTEDNQAQFLSADIKLFLLGAKQWEIDSAIKKIQTFSDHKEVRYLFNYMNGKQFQEIMRQLPMINGDRIPYEPDPFATITHQNGLELFRAILMN